MVEQRCGGHDGRNLDAAAEEKKREERRWRDSVVDERKALLSKHARMGNGRGVALPVAGSESFVAFGEGVSTIGGGSVRRHARHKSRGAPLVLIDRLDWKRRWVTSRHEPPRWEWVWVVCFPGLVGKRRF